MTAVELPSGKLHAWIDHAPDCPELSHAGVFTITPPRVSVPAEAARLMVTAILRHDYLRCHEVAHHEAWRPDEHQ